MKAQAIRERRAASEIEQALVIGGTKGIGRAVAQGLAERGVGVTIVGRSAEGEEVARALGGTFLQADMSLMQEVRRVAQVVLARHSRLDVLVHSADVLRFKRQNTAEGFEVTFATNYLSRFLLNALLLERLKESAPARMIHIAASGVPGTLDLSQVPPQANLSSTKGHNVGQRANDLYGLELAERLQGTGVSINILNPGMVETDIRRNAPGFRHAARAIELLMRPLSKTPEQFAELPLALAISPELSQHGVLIGMNGKTINANMPKYSAELRKGLWERSERLLGLNASEAAAVQVAS